MTWQELMRAVTKPRSTENWRRTRRSSTAPGTDHRTRIDDGASGTRRKRAAILEGMTDPRLVQIAADTEAIKSHLREVQRLRASRARATWSLVQDPHLKETIASISRQIGEPEIRFRKSVETYRDGIPDFKRKID